MKTISFDLTFDQVETLLRLDADFRRSVANKLFNSESVTIETLVRRAIQENPTNKIGAIKALRTSAADYSAILRTLPQNDFGQLGFAAAKGLIVANWERFGGK